MVDQDVYSEISNRANVRSCRSRTDMRRNVLVRFVSAAEQRAHHAAEQRAGAAAGTATAVLVTRATPAATAGRTRHRLIVVR